jgi:putative flippase GtrA
MSAVVLGAFFLHSEFVFARTSSTHQARQVLRMSLIFLPAQFLFLVLDAVSGRMIGY